MKSVFLKSVTIVLYALTTTMIYSGDGSSDSRLSSSEFSSLESGSHEFYSSESSSRVSSSSEHALPTSSRKISSINTKDASSDSEDDGGTSYAQYQCAETVIWTGIVSATAGTVAGRVVGGIVLHGTNIAVGVGVGLGLGIFLIPTALAVGICFAVPCRVYECFRRKRTPLQPSDTPAV